MCDIILHGISINMHQEDVPRHTCSCLGSYYDIVFMYICDKEEDSQVVQCWECTNDITQLGLLIKKKIEEVLFGPT